MFLLPVSVSSCHPSTSKERRLPESRLGLGALHLLETFTNTETNPRLGGGRPTEGALTVV